MSISDDSKDELCAFGRIAFRVEGELWCAYYAKTDTMDGAIFIGSIRLAFVQKPENKNKFKQFIQDGVEETLKELGHTVKQWNHQTAPEHECGGNA